MPLPLSVASEPSPTPFEPIGSWPRTPFSPFAIAFGSGVDVGRRRSGGGWEAAMPSIAIVPDASRASW